MKAPLTKPTSVKEKLLKLKENHACGETYCIKNASFEHFDLAEKVLGSGARVSYEGPEKELFIKFPTGLHKVCESVIQFAAREQENERMALIVRSGTGYSKFRGDYAYTKKSPDVEVLALRASDKKTPSLIAEVGFSQDYERLLKTMRTWLVGTQGAVKAVLLIKFYEYPRFRSPKGTDGLDKEQEHEEDEEINDENSESGGNDRDKETDVEGPGNNDGGELCLARMSISHPLWPARKCDPENVPAGVKEQNGQHLVVQFLVADN
jgi:hypothetical protein